MALSRAVALEKAPPRLPASIRAKLAIETFLNTGRALTALNQFVFPTNVWGSTGHWSLDAGYVSVEQRNFPYHNVNGYNSSVVMACINWISQAFMEAVPMVYRIEDDGDEQAIPNHRFLRFLRRPNQAYNFSKMIKAGLISYYLDGNAYFFKERGDGGSGMTRGLYYIPHYLITPKMDEGQFISWYEYNVNGESFRIPANRIVHIRHGLDPYKPYSGRKILDPVLSEVYTDEEAARFIGALVRNTAIPGIIIMPDTDKVKVDPGAAEALKEGFKRKFGGDNRGEPLITNFAAKVTQAGFSPEQLQFKEVRRLPEERVAAQFQIAPVVAGLGAGLDKSTYNNYEQAERHSYQSALIPVWDEIAEEFSYQLLPEFTGGSSREYVFRFDYSQVRALHESQDAINARLTKLWTVDGITRAELREGVGLPFDPKRDEVFFSEIRVKPGLPAPSPVNAVAPAKSAMLLLKAGTDEENLDVALSMYQEATVKAAIDGMEEDLAALFRQMAAEAEAEAKEGVDPYNPEAEASRVTNDVFKALGVMVMIRGIWGKMAKGIEEDTVTSISLRLAIGEGEVWDEGSSNAVKSLLVQMAQSYESGLIEQTKAAIAEAIKGAEQGESAASIARRIKGMVSGREMYPGVYKEGYDAAIRAGASEDQARRAGESKASRYRAKLIAETETRTYQNQVTLEGYSKGGVQKVKVTDGPDCGWVDHDDLDKAHNSIRLIGDARKYTLAHPNCKRRFFPIRKKA